MLRPALARRLQRRRRTLPQIWLAWLRLSLVMGAAMTASWMMLGGKARAEDSARWIEVAAAEEPPTTGSIAQPSIDGFAGGVAKGAILVRDGTPTRCLPGDLKAVLADVTARFGPVTLESTHRPRSVNRRKGGAPNSLHIACRAIDFRVRARTAGLMAYLRSRPEVGGLKAYRNGIIHIDDGERRRW
ncbi:D-Ala-D-Ala carboxypeptidase family metallohydrolase [Salinarimonas soli]|nr:D-Ala-D-Ala carboxypeptidase family metallohydrolase [Salinarimonas soli]